MEHVVGGDGHQVLAGDGFQLGQTVVLGHQNVLEQVADAAGIAEAGVGALFSDVVADQGLGLRREEVMAIGDSSNDAATLRYAGPAVVMENGSEALKKTADIIAPSNEKGGVADILEMIVRGEI